MGQRTASMGQAEPAAPWGSSAAEAWADLTTLTGKALQRAQLDARSARRWRRWAPHTPRGDATVTVAGRPQDAPPANEADFILNGSSSLAADALPAPAPTQEPTDLVLLGPPDAHRVVLLIPGYGGHAVGLLALGTHLQQALGASTAVGIVDLAAIVERVPPAQATTVGHLVRQRVAELARHIGPQRLVALAGYSLGGLLALWLSQDVPGLDAVPISLIDTSPPLRRTGTPLRGLETRLTRLGMRVRASLRTRLGRTARPAAPTSTHPPVQVEAPATNHHPQAEAQWQALLQHLHQPRPAHHGFKAARAAVQLVRAAHSRYTTGLLWRGASNGLNGRNFAKLATCAVPATHLELPRSAAATVAHLLATHMAAAPTAAPAQQP